MFQKPNLKQNVNLNYLFKTPSSLDFNLINIAPPNKPQRYLHFIPLNIRIADILHHFNNIHK